MFSPAKHMQNISSDDGSELVSVYVLAALPLNWSADILGHAEVLRRLYKEVSRTLEAQSVARNMFQLNVLTLKELQSIQSKHKKPVKAAERLLNIVIKQSRNAYSCFLEALKLTSQQHLYEVIVTGSCKGTKMLP